MWSRLLQELALGPETGTSSLSEEGNRKPELNIRQNPACCLDTNKELGDGMMPFAEKPSDWLLFPPLTVNFDRDQRLLAG